MRSFRDSFHERRQFTYGLAYSFKGYWGQKWPNIVCLRATNMQTLKSLCCWQSWLWFCVSDPWRVRDTVCTSALMATAGFVGKVSWNMDRLPPPLSASSFFSSLYQEYTAGEERSNTTRNWDQPLPQPGVLRKVSLHHWNHENAKSLTFAWRNKIKCKLSM